MIDRLTINRPHVPYGPAGVSDWTADADYLDSAARNIAGGHEVGGHNVTATVIQLLHEVANQLRLEGQAQERAKTEATALLAQADAEEAQQRSRSSHLTTDPTDPRLTHGIDDKPVPQADAYLILPEEERAKGFIRPVRRAYVHDVCGTRTTMSVALAETYARDPKFYGATYCVSCGLHAAVAEFVWDGTTERVGS